MTETPQQHGKEQKAQVQDYFSRTAESYVASFEHRQGDDLSRLIELGAWNTQQSALDVATGGGHTALAVAPHVARVTVTDLTPQMLAKAREFLLAQGVTNAQFQVADAEQLPFADETFDRVTCRIAPHHFPNVALAVKEAARVLKHGGLYLVIDCMVPDDPELDAFDNTVEKRRDSSHGRSCNPEEWRAFFTQAGLLVEHIEFFRKTHYYEPWTTRSQLPATEKAELEQFMVESAPRIQSYFEIKRLPDGHVESFTNDFILLVGRKV